MLDPEIKCETCLKILAVVESADHIPLSGEIICRACADKRLKRRKLRAA